MNKETRTSYFKELYNDQNIIKEIDKEYIEHQAVQTNMILSSSEIYKKIRKLKTRHLEPIK